jgi:hypothetical protein
MTTLLLLLLLLLLQGLLDRLLHGLLCRRAIVVGGGWGRQCYCSGLG